MRDSLIKNEILLEFLKGLLETKFQVDILGYSKWVHPLTLTLTLTLTSTLNLTLNPKPYYNLRLRDPRIYGCNPPCMEYVDYSMHLTVK